MSKIQFLILGGDSRLALGFQKVYPNLITMLSKNECNILDENSIKKTLKKYKNKYIINCAAITDMDYCEKNPKECFETNIVGPYLLNAICKEFDRKLVHISSDYAPIHSNIYGLSKYVSEKMIDKSMLIVRTNFYDEKTYIVKELLKNRSIETYSNVYSNPISITNLVKEIMNKKDKHGLLNIFSDKKINFYSFASTFVEVFMKDKKLIKKITYKNDSYRPYRPLSSYIKPDITVKIKDDLLVFRDYLTHENN